MPFFTSDDRGAWKSWTCMRSVLQTENERRWGTFFSIKTYRGKDWQYEKDSQIGKSPLRRPLGGDFCSQIKSKNSQTWKMRAESRLLGLYWQMPFPLRELAHVIAYKESVYYWEHNKWMHVCHLYTQLCTFALFSMDKKHPANLIQLVNPSTSLIYATWK